MFYFPLRPFWLFLFPQSLQWTPGETVWHWWLGEGIISMSKISISCQTCQHFHSPLHNTHKHCARKHFQCPCQDVFFYSWEQDERRRVRKRALVLTYVTFLGRCSSLFVRWGTVRLAGAQSRHSTKPRYKWFCFVLAPLTDILSAEEVCDRKVLCCIWFVFLHSCWLVLFC